MSKEAIIVTALFKAKKGKEDALKKELMTLIEPTRNEKGCIQYNLHQFFDDPESFIFYEHWENEETLAKHKESEHLKKCVHNIKNLIAEHPQVRFLELL